ncbi:MAG: hypothetical protein J6S63_12240 [Atopobiaceae bacterium]|nr:hypothetical protein [Atopobiaceae bacterium]
MNPSSIFNTKAAERLRSPDDLDKYVRVTRPSVWVVLVACIALLAGLLAWGFLGTVSTNVSVSGTVLEGRALCLLPQRETAQIDVGDAAYVGGTKMQVAVVENVPLSRDEAYELLGSDYLVSTLMEGDWAVLVVFEGDVSALEERVPIPVSITTERVAPLALVFGE